MLFPSDKTPKLPIALHGFNVGQEVVRLFEDHQHDNRIYVVQEQFGTYYTGRTNVQALHGDRSFMLDTTKLRPATAEERDAHCRIYADDDLEVVIEWSGK